MFCWMGKEVGNESAPSADAPWFSSKNYDTVQTAARPCIVIGCTSLMCLCDLTYAACVPAYLHTPSLTYISIYQDRTPVPRSVDICLLYMHWSTHDVAY